MTTASATVQSTSNKKARPVPPPRNGIDTPTLLATVAAVGAQPQLADFRFRATNRWISGTHSRSSMQNFYGAGADQQHTGDYVYDADHPGVLCGSDAAPTPVEFLLHALAGCLTAGIGNIAAARGIDLHEVESTVEGDVNLLGLLGLSDEVRNGYQSIVVRFKIRGDASPEQLRALIDRSRSRSAVFDVLTNGVPVTIDVDAA